MEKIGGITKHICFRTVEPDDAEFILSLRTDPAKSQFISFTENDIARQRAWIEASLERSKAGQEYYYIIEDTAGERLGTVRLYDFQGDSFAWGSWILKDGSPYYVGLESFFMAVEVGFYRHGFTVARGDVRKGNSSVWKNHLRLGAKIVAETEQDYSFAMSKSEYEVTKAKYRKFFVNEDDATEGGVSA